jgi:hypothetical protein
MQLQSGRTSPPHPWARETIPYSSAALRQDLERLRDVWEDCQATRDRNAIYGYLTAVYGLVAWWIAEGREADRARRALHLQRLAVSDREDPFASIIRCTADPAKADERTRSKWSRLMRYAAAYKFGHRDCVLPLDESGDSGKVPLQEKAKTLAFMIARNRPRRLSKKYERANALQDREYRIIAQSSSELALSQVAIDAGGRRLGGEEVRFTDVPSSDRMSLGIFELRGIALEEVAHIQGRQKMPAEGPGGD